jgi:CheY-like chemotaxis protein
MPAPFADLSGLTILLVDDHDDSLYILERTFIACRATVLAERNPVAALARLETSLVDVIISDLSMPQMDGLQFIQRVRSSSKHRATPAIALTAFPDDYLNATRVGFNAFVPKPLDIDKLCAVVGKVTRRT